MEQCSYHGKTICTFDLKDENGYYLEELVLEWKQAAAARRLSCIECGAPVYLAAGLIKEPYFAHYDLVECDYGNGYESEELKKGKRLLYSLMKKSFPEADVIVRYRMDNGMYSTLYSKIDNNGAIAIDYRLQNNSLEKFLEREAFYQDKGILALYILGAGLDKDHEQLDWYQTLIQKSMGYVAFLDTLNEQLIFKKSFGYRIGRLRKFKQSRHSYPIQELKINSDGQMDCDFSEECSRILYEIDEEKECYRLEQEKLRLMNELDPVLFMKCKQMIEEGNGHLVSRKYYDAIMEQHRKDRL